MKSLLFLSIVVAFVSARVAHLSLCICNDDGKCAITRGSINGESFVTELNEILPLDELKTAPRHVCNSRQQSKRMLLDSGGLKVDTPIGSVGVDQNGLNANVAVTAGPVNLNGNLNVNQNGQVSGGASGQYTAPDGSSVGGNVQVDPNGNVNAGASGSLNGIGTMNGKLDVNNGKVSGGVDGTVNLPGGSSLSGNVGVDQNGNTNLGGTANLPGGSSLSGNMNIGSNGQVSGGANGNFNMGNFGSLNAGVQSNNGQTTGNVGGNVNLPGGSSLNGNMNFGPNGQVSGNANGNFNLGSMGSVNAGVQSNNGQTTGNVGGNFNLPGGSSLNGNMNFGPNGQVSGGANGNFNMGNMGSMSMQVNLPNGQQQGGMKFDLSGIQGGQSGTGFNPATFFSQAGMDQFKQQMMGKRHV